MGILNAWVYREGILISYSILAMPLFYIKDLSHDMGVPYFKHSPLKRHLD